MGEGRMSDEIRIEIPSFLTASTYAASRPSDDCGHICEDSCQLSCEKSSQCSGCEGSACEHDCQNYCQNSNQCGSCESTCEDQGPCIGGQGLPCGNSERGDCGGCEDGCQDCESDCMLEQLVIKKVTCTKISYFYNNSKDVLLDTSTETESGFTPGKIFTPSAHMPDYDSNKYELYKIEYSGITLSTTSNITCPSSDFTIKYYFYAKKILEWDWSKKNGKNATAEQTQVAYNAITGKGTTASFNYAVWNDLVDKVVEVWHAQNGYFNTSKLSYEETCMSESDKTLPAARFNSLRYNIGINSPTSIEDKKPGDQVLGSYFIILTNSLNAWIRKVNETL